MIPNRALVVGIGATGESCARFLSGRTDLYVTDTRVGRDDSVAERFQDLRQKYTDAEFIMPHELLTIADAKTVVYASPGIPLDDPIFDGVRSCGSRISCDIELFCSLIDVPLVGVTGTNGKTTTTSLVANMLRPKGYAVGGNIGEPVLDLLDSLGSGYVLELSSFQLEKMSPPRLKSATVLNITEDHQDHHRTFEEYVAAKMRIYDQSDVAVYNSSDSRAKPFREMSEIAVNGTEDWRVREDDIVIAGEVVPKGTLKLVGPQNHLNIVIAAALAHVAGANVDDIIDVATSFEGLPHRMQCVAEIDGVRYVNDSKATNVAATCAALESLSNGSANVLLLAGGDAKGASFEPLIDRIHQYTKAVILYGRDATRIAAALGDATKCVFADSLEVAVMQASELARSSDVVMLSPACASFDMFTDYQQRGDHFISLVKAMEA